MSPLRRALVALVLAGLLAGAAVAQSSGAVDAAAVPRVLRFGVLADFPPYQVWPEGNAPGGADLDLLREIALGAGLAIEPVRYADLATLEADLAAGRIDVAGAMARTPRREQQLLFSRPYSQFPLALVTRADAPSGSLIPDLAGRSIAVISGYASEDQAQQLFPLATRVVVASVQQGLRAVESGRADTLLEALPVVVHLIASERHGGLVVARRIETPSGRLHLAVSRDRPELVPLLSNGIERLPPGRVQTLVQGWSARVPEPAAPSTLVLDEDDRARLARWARPVVGIVGHEPPFAAAGADGVPEGLSVDLLQGALARLGVAAASYRFLGVADVPAAVADGSVDLLLGLEETADLAPALRFVGPFVEYPSVFVGRPEGGAFDLQQLQGRRLALAAGSSARPLLESRHPGIELVACADMADCVARVVRGDADAVLADVVTAVLTLSRQPSGNVQIIGAEPRLRRFHSLGVAARHAEVVSLLQRALASAVANDLPALKVRWFSQAPRDEIVRTEALRWAPWVAGAVLVLLGLWGWHSSRLRGEVARTRQAQVQAESAERASRRFTAFLAHEVRNSLHAVIGGTELLRSKPAPQLADALHTTARGTLQLLNNLLDRERLDAGRLVLHPEPVELAPLIDELVQEMRPAADQRGLSLSAWVAPELPALQLDALRVQQVMRNLLANAIRYSERGGMELRATGTSLAPHRWRVALSVVDQGRGIRPEDRAHLFEHHASSGNGEASSSGLGLPLSRDLARLMGGDVSIESTPGQGTTATLVFEADAVASAGVSAIAGVASAGTPGPDHKPSAH